MSELSPDEAAARFVEWFTMAPPEQTGDVVHDVVSRIRARQAGETIAMVVEPDIPLVEDADDSYGRHSASIPLQDRADLPALPDAADIYWW